MVDDNETNRRLLRLQLESWGARPTLAESGAVALELLEGGARFDYALLDMHMPAMDGLELATRLRETPGGESLPLVMLTSLSQRERAPASSLFAAFLTKPIKASRLYNTLLGLLGAGVPTQASRAGEEDELGKPALSRVARVLIAEDNAINQKVASLSLRRLGVRAAVASNGLEAIQALLDVEYDLVFMDVHMPELDGLEATRRIRARADVRQPYIAAVTANATVKDRARCLEVGMNDYISKPYRLRDMYGVLERFERWRTGGGAASERDTLDAGALDPAALENLKELLGTDERAKIEGFLEDVLPDIESLVETLVDAAARADASAVTVAAHTLKGNCGTVGASELSALARTIEAQAQRGTLEDLDEQLASMRPALARYHDAVARARARW
ncbi:MAG: response regulator [Myxococcales bacterium]|nr:response regulator [Myxococcales bacterium]